MNTEINVLSDKRLIDHFGDLDWNGEKIMMLICKNCNEFCCKHDASKDKLRQFVVGLALISLLNILLPSLNALLMG